METLKSLWAGLKLRALPILAVLLLASLSFAAIQTSRLSSANAKVDTFTQARKDLVDRTVRDRAQLDTRDQLIAKQNARINALVAAGAQAKAEYELRLRKADKVAQGYQAQAGRIAAAQTSATDEVGRCRAALKLIVDTLTEERTTDVLP